MEAAFEETGGVGVGVFAVTCVDVTVTTPGGRALVVDDDGAVEEVEVVLVVDELVPVVVEDVPLVVPVVLVPVPVVAEELPEEVVVVLLVVPVPVPVPVVVPVLELVEVDEGEDVVGRPVVVGKICLGHARKSAIVKEGVSARIKNNHGGLMRVKRAFCLRNGAGLNVANKELKALRIYHKW